MTRRPDPVGDLADRLARTKYPLDEESSAVLELKYGLTFYNVRPFPVAQIESVYDLYAIDYGHAIRRYRSTSPAGIMTDMEPQDLRSFRAAQLPNLYRQGDWGYGFDDGREVGAKVFVFHSFRPVSESGIASFVRFEFPTTTEPAELAAFSVEVARRIDFSSGTCGLVAFPHAFVSETFDAAFAICRRYYGAEAWNLDVTIREIGGRAKTIGWITLLGPALAAECGDLDRRLDAAEIERVRWSAGLAIRSRATPALIDRNRNEGIEPETAVYRMLRPALMETHSSFGGERWTDDKATAWLHRFDPERLWIT